MKFIALLAFLFATSSPAANLLSCQDGTANGQKITAPGTTYPNCSLQLTISAARIGNGLAARSNSGTKADAYWSSWRGIPDTVYVLTDSGAFVLKSAINQSAATPANGFAQLSWLVPTQNVDGSPVIPPLTYKVYGGLATPLAFKTSTATSGYLWTGLTPGMWLFAVSAVDKSGTESALSAPVTKIISAAPAPQSPTGVSAK